MTLTVLLKHFSILSIGEAASRVILFLATILLAKVLEPANFGKLSFAQAHVSYFMLLVNFGFDYIGIREVSKDPSLCRPYANRIVSLRILFAAVSFLLLGLTILLMNKTTDVKLVALILGIGLFFSAFDLTWLYQALQRMLWVAGLKFVRSLGLLFLLWFSFYLPNNLFFIACCFMLSSAFAAFFFLHHLCRASGFHFAIDFTKGRRLIEMSFPVFLMLLTVTIYFNIDILILGVLTDDRTVGVYSAAYKLVLAGITPITVWLTACSPELSKRPLVFAVWFHFAWVNVTIGLLVSGTLFFFFAPLMSLLFGPSYNASPDVFRLLSLIPLCSACAGSVTNPLTFWGFPSRHLIVTGIGAAVNVLLNVWWIPKYSMAGAAMATVAAEMSVALLGCVMIGLTFFSNRSPVPCKGLD